ncbi:uncharacterized protein LOC131616374 [Vicia villosa]|uniref:uncharacterized protein LOC131616374 n=1 Tax=Vicia villosa TaxID=3911 RepID=UPI00273ACD59|nr:uncharacterized protein LOC131616374 [Vicia villosa]
MNFARKKRVTDPFDDEAKARLVGGNFRRLSGVSSGSEHSGDGEFTSSPSLSELVHDFLEEDEENQRDSAENDFESERVDSVSECLDSVEDLLLSAENANADSYMNTLRVHVSEAAAKFAFLKEQSFSVFNRNVMSFLREKGHNAAICKTRWESSGGITAGSHEFIDVVRSGSSTWQSRYFVELNFAGQFEIARPTSRYTEIMSYVPAIFVGTWEELKRTVLALCGAVKLCLRSRGLSIPPWRKNRYMQNKWFGPYRRTTNPVQGNPVPGVVSSFSGAKCRLVGFNDAVSETRHSVSFVRTR